MIFSNITVALNTIIAGWSVRRAGTPNYHGNTGNWTGGTTAVTEMSINGFGGTSSVSNNTISTHRTQGYYRFTYWCSWYSYSATVSTNTINLFLLEQDWLQDCLVLIFHQLLCLNDNGLASSLSIAFSSWGF
jgi:hypothetical protein